MNTNIRFTRSSLTKIIETWSAAVSVGLLLSSCTSPATLPDSPTSSTQYVANDLARSVPAAKLYVANTLSNTVTVYSASTGVQLRTISQGVVTPKALEFDSVGNLYVLNWHKGSPLADNNVSIYKPGGTSPSQLIVKKLCHPSSLTVGDDNRIYVGNGCLKGPHRGVRIYAAGTYDPTAEIRNGIDGVRATAVGKTGTLYVANARSWNVQVYAPRTWSHLQTLTQTNPPFALAINDADYLFVANGDSTIAEYAPGSATPLRTIKQGLAAPNAMTIDALGNLDVLNFGNALGPASISVYASDGTFIRSITDGIDKPVALAADTSGTLYVANFGKNSITIYPSGSSTASMTISTGIHGPDAIALGP